MGFFAALFLIYLYFMALPVAIPATALVITVVAYRKCRPGLGRTFLTGWCLIGTALIVIGSVMMYRAYGMDWLSGSRPNPILFFGVFMMIPAFYALFFVGD
jgi:hypothetical protein